MIPLERIHPNPANIRADLGDLTELAASIREVGLLQPLVVTQHRDGWLILDGHRRYAAAKQAGAQALPCLASKHGDVDGQLSTMLAAAMHKQLEPLDQARAFARLRARRVTVAEIARRTGYSTSTVQQRLLLIDLPDEVQDMVTGGQITLAEATRLARDVRQHGAGSAHTGAPRRPAWFGPTHRLAATVRAACTHLDRHRYGGQGCGQCWEAALLGDPPSPARGGVTS